MFDISIIVSQYCDDKHFLALGKCIIRINQTSYGLDNDDASWLGNTVQEIENRILNRGNFNWIDIRGISATEISQKFLSTIYGSTSDNFVDEKLTDYISRNKLMWIPDGDSAFDDGSHVLQCDVENEVRLVGFKNEEETASMLQTVEDITISADLFYGILQNSLARFNCEREAWLRIRHKS